MTVHEEDFAVRGYESGVNDRVALPVICNYLQEAAGNHAKRLGFGIRELQAREGTSWMLSRLHLRISKYVSWGDVLHVKTWPSGIRGRLSALRDFLCTDAGGTELLEGVSEWLMVNLSAQRIVKPTDDFKALSAGEMTRVALAGTEGGGKFAALARTDVVARILVRRSDHDFNDHVNNVHYVEWALEALPETFRNRQPSGLDIVFRRAAHAGDELEARTEVVSDATLRHAIVRLSDGELLVTAETEWENGNE